MTETTEATATEVVRFLCPHCGKRNKAPTSAAGKGGTCKSCGGGVEVPDLKRARDARRGRFKTAVPPVPPVMPLRSLPPAPIVREIAQLSSPSIRDEPRPAVMPPLPDHARQEHQDHLSLLAEAASNRVPAEQPRRSLLDRGVPWWLVAVAHIAVPVTTAVVFWYLYTSGYMPGLHQFLK